MQYNLPPKALFTTPDGRQFIWFRNTKLSLWIEVSNFHTKAEAMRYIFEATNTFTADNKPTWFTDFQFGSSSWCVLLILEYQNLSGLSIPQIDKHLENHLKRLSGWYKFTYLIPNAQT
jgi:hypothetical protein